MSEPLGELENALAYMFELQKTHQKGKYINPLVEKLKNEIETYKKNPSNLNALITSLIDAYPVIESYADSYMVKQKIEALAESKNLSISWPKQESSTEESVFNVWLSSKIGKNFAILEQDKQVQILLNQQMEKELRVKLGVHLHIEPDFLFNLAMFSTSNFIRLINSRLGFKFEKHQVAKAICHHGDTMIDNSLDPHEQVDQLINFLDKKLAPKGYSIEKLLSDPVAKMELEKMKLIQVYQSLEYKNRHDDGLNQLKLN